MSKRAALLFLTVIISLHLCAQEEKTPQDSFLESEYFFMYGDYADSLSGYLKI